MKYFGPCENHVKILHHCQFFVLSRVCGCWSLNVSNMWLPFSGFPPGSDFKTGLIAVPLQKSKTVPHSINEHLGLVEGLCWRRKHSTCLHQKNLIQILRHLCSSSGPYLAASRKGLVSPFLSLVQCPQLPHVCFLACGDSPSFFLLSPSSFYIDCLSSIQLQAVMPPCLIRCQIKKF